MADLSGFDREFAAEAFLLNVSAIQNAQWGNETNQSKSVKNVAQRIIKDHTNALARLKQISQEQNFGLPAPAATDQQSNRGKLKNETGDALRQDYLRRELAERQHEIGLCEREVRDGNEESLRTYCGEILPGLREQMAMLQPALDE